MPFTKPGLAGCREPTIRNANQTIVPTRSMGRKAAVRVTDSAGGIGSTAWSSLPIENLGRGIPSKGWLRRQEAELRPAGALSVQAGYTDAVDRLNHFAAAMVLRVNGQDVSP